DPRRRAEDPERDRLVRLPAETLLHLGRLRALDDLAAGPSERVEDRDDRIDVADLAVLREVRAVDGADEVGAPRLLRREARGARRDEAVPREARRPPERQPVLHAQPLDVAPHVPALRRIDVEGRVVPPLGPEDGPEEKRLPDN